MTLEPERPDAPSYRGRRVLVTGGGGYIGSELAPRLRQAGAEVTLLVRDAGKVPPHAAAAAARIVEADLRQADIPPEAVKTADVVFHLAAQASAVVAARDPQADWDVNVRPLLA